MATQIFLYLSDDPQAYLLFLKDYIRPCTDICHSCKVRCVETFVKTVSGPGLAWNVLSPDERPRPAYTLLDAQLADLGVNSSNNYGLDLSEEEINKIFQPAVRRLTLDPNWQAIVNAFAAMTCSRVMDAPDDTQYQFDQYKLGKKVLWMGCPQLTAQELVRPRPTEITSTWLWNLAQLLSDGAGAYLSSSLPDTEAEHVPPSSCHTSSSSMPHLADAAVCTCPIFSVLNGRHPGTYNGYEWINLILRAAQQRIEPALLEAWSQPLTSEELLSSSAPYRPLCPGYDCQTDRTWQEDQLHKGNLVVDTERYSNGWYEISVNLVRLLGANNEDEDDDAGPGPDRLYIPPCNPLHPLESFKPGFLLPTGTPFYSASIPPQFRIEYLRPYHHHLPTSRFGHSFRQRLLKTFLARTFRLNPRYDTGDQEMPDLFVRAVFASSFHTSSHSYTHLHSQSHDDPYHHPLPLPLSPMKSLFDHALHSFRHHQSQILQTPLNSNTSVKAFRMPRCHRIEGNPHMGFEARPSAIAQGWPDNIHDQQPAGPPSTVSAENEDRILFWGYRYLMRRVFDWEGDQGAGDGWLGWERELLWQMEPQEEEEEEDD